MLAKVLSGFESEAMLEILAYPVSEFHMSSAHFIDEHRLKQWLRPVFVLSKDARSSVPTVREPDINQEIGMREHSISVLVVDVLNAHRKHRQTR